MFPSINSKPANFATSIYIIAKINAIMKFISGPATDTIASLADIEYFP